MHLFGNDETDGPTGMSDTSPLLPNRQENYESKSQEKPRKSSREQGAERFHATPHGQYMNTTREGLKKLLTHPKQFLEEAIGAGMAEREEEARSKNFNGRHAGRSGEVGRGIHAVPFVQQTPPAAGRSASNNSGYHQTPAVQHSMGSTASTPRYMYDQPPSWHNVTSPSRDGTTMAVSGPGARQTPGSSHNVPFPSRNGTTSSSSQSTNEQSSEQSMNATPPFRNETISIPSRPNKEQLSDRRKKMTLPSRDGTMLVSSRPAKSQSTAGHNAFEAQPKPIPKTKPVVTPRPSSVYNGASRPVSERSSSRRKVPETPRKLDPTMKLATSRPSSTSSKPREGATSLASASSRPHPFIAELLADMPTTAINNAPHAQLEALPLGWYEDKTSKGRTYFYTLTGLTQWKRPTSNVCLSPSVDLPSGWYHGRRPDGAEFFYNDAGDREWERPTHPVDRPAQQATSSPTVAAPRSNYQLPSVDDVPVSAVSQAVEPKTVTAPTLNATAVAKGMQMGMTPNPMVPKPAVTQPVVAKPVVAKSSALQPALSKHTEALQDMSKPKDAQPMVLAPAVSKPVVSKPEVSGSVHSQPFTSAVTPKTIAPKSVVLKPAAAKPVVAKPLAAETIVTKPFDIKSTTLTPVALKLIVPKPVALQPQNTNTSVKVTIRTPKSDTIAQGVKMGTGLKPILGKPSIVTPHVSEFVSAPPKPSVIKPTSLKPEARIPMVVLSPNIAQPTLSNKPKRHVSFPQPLIDTAQKVEKKDVEASKQPVSGAPKLLPLHQTPPTPPATSTATPCDPAADLKQNVEVFADCEDNSIIQFYGPLTERDARFEMTGGADPPGSLNVDEDDEVWAQGHSHIEHTSIEDAKEEATTPEDSASEPEHAIGASGSSYSPDFDVGESDNALVKDRLDASESGSTLSSRNFPHDVAKQDVQKIAPLQNGNGTSQARDAWNDFTEPLSKPYLWKASVPELNLLPEKHSSPPQLVDEPEICALTDNGPTRPVDDPADLVADPRLLAEVEASPTESPPVQKPADQDDMSTDAAPTKSAPSMPTPAVNPLMDRSGGGKKGKKNKKGRPVAGTQDDGKNKKDKKGGKAPHPEQSITEAQDESLPEIDEDKVLEASAFVVEDDAKAKEEPAFMPGVEEQSIQDDPESASKTDVEATSASTDDKKLVQDEPALSSKVEGQTIEDDWVGFATTKSKKKKGKKGGAAPVPFAAEQKITEIIQPSRSPHDEEVNLGSTKGVSQHDAQEVRETPVPVWTGQDLGVDDDWSGFATKKSKKKGKNSKMDQGFSITEPETTASAADSPSKDAVDPYSAKKAELSSCAPVDVEPNVVAAHDKLAPPAEDVSPLAQDEKEKDDLDWPSVATKKDKEKGKKGKGGEAVKPTPEPLASTNEAEIVLRSDAGTADPIEVLPNTPLDVLTAKEDIDLPDRSPAEPSENPVEVAPINGEEDEEKEEFDGWASFATNKDKKKGKKEKGEPIIKPKPMLTASVGDKLEAQPAENALDDKSEPVLDAATSTPLVEEVTVLTTDTPAASEEAQPVSTVQQDEKKADDDWSGFVTKKKKVKKGKKGN